MFTTITWSNYIIAIGVLLLGWYLFLGFRFYYPELKQLLSGNRSITFPSIGNKKTKRPNLTTDDKDGLRSASSCESFNTLGEVEELSGLLINAITENAERNVSKVVFRNCLTLILRDYSYAKGSELRAKVNELMVSECEKHPQMILTYAEVDGLWDETI
jgi:hypothetical protein